VQILAPDYCFASMAPFGRSDFDGATRPSVFIRGIPMAGRTDGQVLYPKTPLVVVAIETYTTVLGAGHTVFVLETFDD
jgi:hypothetical protein